MKAFILTGWTTCADDIDYGPKAFPTFEAARAAANELDTSSRDWWFQKRPGRALRWKDPKNHDRGFWEILTN